MNCKKDSVVRRNSGADPVVVYQSENPTGICVFNKHVVPPLDLYTGWPGLTCMPDDSPDETTLDMLKNAFPEANGADLLRLEDHIRHEPATLICVCAKEDADEILKRLQPVKENISFETAQKYRNYNSALLPALNGGQWKICTECKYFSLKNRQAKCSNRWHCKWGAANPREWDVDKTHVYCHSQCTLIERHFRFENLLLSYVERFREDVLNEENPEYFFAERKRLLHRDLAAAVQKSNFGRIQKRCAQLNLTFAEFAEKHDIFPQMLNNWQVNNRLIETVRFLRNEGISVPEDWCGQLLKLTGEKKLCQELHQLLDARPECIGKTDGVQV